MWTGKDRNGEKLGKIVKKRKGGEREVKKILGFWGKGRKGRDKKKYVEGEQREKTEKWFE